MKKLKLTKEGVAKLNKEIEDKKEELRELGKYKASAAENEGDAWHDNFAFEQAEIQERRLIRAINDLQAELDSAEIIEASNNKSKVNIGSRVTISMQFSEEEAEEYTFSVGSIGNIEENIVSINSPLGECVFGKSVGYKSAYKVNDNVVKVEILQINN